MIGGNKVNVFFDDYSKDMHLSGMTINSNQAVLTAPEGSSARLFISDSNINNLKVSNLDKVTLSGQMSGNNITVNNSNPGSGFVADGAYGTLNQLNVNGGTLFVNQTDGELRLTNSSFNSDNGGCNAVLAGGDLRMADSTINVKEIGRASCREGRSMLGSFVHMRA